MDFVPVSFTVAACALALLGVGVWRAPRFAHLWGLACGFLLFCAWGVMVAGTLAEAATLALDPLREVRNALPH